MQKIKVETDSNTRLDRYLRQYFGQMPQSMIEQMLRNKDVLVNDRKQKSNYRLQVDDEITIKVEVEQPKSMQKNMQNAVQNPKLFDRFQQWVLYEDKNICIISKPFDVPTQGGSKIFYSVDSMANSSAQKYYIVHRLDRHTSGLLLLAKSPEVATLYARAFEKKTIQKYYVAIIEGKPEKCSGLIDIPIGPRLVDGVEKMFVLDDGKPCQTRYRVVKHLNDNRTLVILKPYTGRKHQLRVHMSSLGLPIVGDRKYGQVVKDERLCLHAYKLCFNKKCFVSMKECFSF